LKSLVDQASGDYLNIKERARLPDGDLIDGRIESDALDKSKG
jgi:hypothetical protein